MSQTPGGTAGVKPRIRNMLPSDLDSVVSIEERSFPNPWTRDQFMAELGRKPVSRCYVSVKEGGGEGRISEEIVTGFIMAWLVADELHITNLAVDPEMRRTGAAASLLGKSMREAMQLGAKWCQLEVRASNKPAQNLYRRFGFRPLGIRKRYYHNGEDAVVMGREI